MSPQSSPPRSRSRSAESRGLRLRSAPRRPASRSARQTSRKPWRNRSPPCSARTTPPLPSHAVRSRAVPPGRAAAAHQHHSLGRAPTNSVNVEHHPATWLQSLSRRLQKGRHAPGRTPPSPPRLRHRCEPSSSPVCSKRQNE